MLRTHLAPHHIGRFGTCLVLSLALVGLAVSCGAGDRDDDMSGGVGPDEGDDGEGDDGGDGGGDDGTSDGDDGTEDGGDGDTGTGDGGDDGGDGGECDTPSDLDQFSNFKNARDLFELLNDLRGQYGAEPPYGWHDRYKGIPWEGEGHNHVTFPVRFNWDHDLACRAQVEAERLADGGSPMGTMVDGQNGCCGDFYVDGLDTTDWRLSWHENDPAQQWAMTNHNGSARMGFFYHDFGGDGPAINSMGIGAAVRSDNTVWWVIQFGTDQGSGPSWDNDDQQPLAGNPYSHCISDMGCDVRIGTISYCHLAADGSDGVCGSDCREDYGSPCGSVAGGTATPVCLDTDFIYSQQCALDCTGGKTCPNGMECHETCPKGNCTEICM
jgi:hypothetical protein